MPRVVRDGQFVLAAISLLLVTSPAFSTDDLLHARIDEMIDASHVGPPAAMATDAEYLRRLSLDLRGTIPTAAEAREFLDDASETKRAAWIDRLIESPDYARHMSEVFDVMLMERRGETHIKTDPWRQFLRESFEQNKPYNALAREILSADGTDEKPRPAARFFLDRTVEPNLMTRDIGRIFFGRDFQCAQCHDHPLIDDYLQSDYYGIYAFVDRSYLFTDKDKKVFVAEKPDSVVKFQSVFDPDANGETAPALPGEAELQEPHFKRGEEYAVAPAKNVRPVPKYSRRARLAELATSGTNIAFNRNIANRLWAHMMGRGLVEPRDLHHPDNPPSHPELMAVLADKFAVMNFDIKAFLRELALTRTYQRSFEPPASIDQLAAAAATALTERKKRYEQITATAADSDTAASASRDVWETAKETFAPLSEELAQAKTAVNAAIKPAGEAKAALAKSQGELDAKQELARLLGEALAGAKAAAERLADDQEIVQAAVLFEARAGNLNGELPALQKQVNEKSAAATQANETLAAADQTVEQVALRLEETRQPARAAHAKFADLDQRRKDDQTLATATERAVAAAEKLMEHCELLSSIDNGGRAVAAMKASRHSAEQDVAERQAAMSQPESALAEARNAQAGAAQALAAVQQQLQTSQETAAAVADAVEKTGLALEKLPGDAQLVKADESLKSRLNGLTTEAAEFEKTTLKPAQANAEAAQQNVANAESLLATATSELSVAQQILVEIDGQLQAAMADVAAARAAADVSSAELAEIWSRQFAIASLSPLTPEQLAWSTMRATGTIGRQRAAAEAELKKAQAEKIKKEQEEKAKQAEADGENAAAAQPVEPPPIGPAEIERALQQRLKGPLKVFVRLFGAGAGQPQTDFFATVDQALFMANAGTLKSWLSPSGENLTARLIKLEDPAALAEELYLSLLTRRPSAEERAAVATYIGKRPEQRSEAIQELAWALLTSTEFRFRH